MTDCRAHPFNLIGSNGRPYTAAAEQDTAFDDSCCDGAGKLNGEVWIVVVAVVEQLAELDNLVADAQRVIRGVEPQDLRDNAGLRQHVATEMSRVQSVLDGLLVNRPRRNILRRPK